MEAYGFRGDRDRMRRYDSLDNRFFVFQSKRGIGLRLSTFVAEPGVGRQLGATITKLGHSFSLAYCRADPWRLDCTLGGAMRSLFHAPSAQRLRKPNQIGSERLEEQGAVGLEIKMTAREFAA